MSSLDIIDPPVTPHSSVEDINAWIKELEKRESSGNVVEAIAQAKEWLEWKKDWKNDTSK